MLHVFEGSHKVGGEALSLSFPLVALNFRALHLILQSCHVQLQLLDLRPQDRLTIL